MKLLNPNNENILFIPCAIYFDDFEYPNPLGSHKNIQKIGVVYIKFLNLPEKISSKLSFIFLWVWLFLRMIGKNLEMGNSELNSLEKEGILIQHPKYHTVKIVPAVIIGDNLGLNSILGFNESFSSTFYCRFCKNKSEMRYMLTEWQCYLRNIENYTEDVDINDATLTGVRENSIWNVLENYHVTKNFCVDYMHDILEGVAHYDLLLIFQKLIL